MGRGKGVELSQSVVGDRAAVESLYEREAGRVFAYCYARIGSRSLAEWAVGATFDRAREQAANGGLPDQELDWLLRTADKFCSPTLKLGEEQLAAGGALVLRDWNGASFDQIAAELDEHRTKLETARQELSPWRRLLGAIGIGPGGWLQGAFGGATALKAGAAAVAVTGAVVVVGTPVGDRLHDTIDSPAKKPTPAVVTPAATGDTTPGTAQTGSGGTAPPANGQTTAKTPAKSGGAKTPKPGATQSGGSSSAPAAAAGGGQTAAPSAAGTTTSARPTSGVSGGTGVQTTPGETPPAAGKVTTTAARVTLPRTPTTSTPTVSTPAPVTTPTVATPTVSTPTVPTPTVSTPSVTTPTVSTPTASVPTPTVSTPSAPVPTPSVTVAQPPPVTVSTPVVTVTTPKLP